MDKRQFREYLDLKKEIDILKARLSEIKRQLAKFEGNYVVTDVVSGGEGGTRRYSITGFPYPEYKRKTDMLLSRKMKLERQQDKLEEQTEAIETYIRMIENSKMRNIFTLFYLEGKSWREIAADLGEGYSADAVRKAHDRFWEAKKE